MRVNGRQKKSRTVGNRRRDSEWRHRRYNCDQQPIRIESAGAVWQQIIAIDWDYGDAARRDADEQMNNLWALRVVFVE